MADGFGDSFGGNAFGNDAFGGGGDFGGGGGDFGNAGFGDGSFGGDGFGGGDAFGNGDFGDGAFGGGRKGKKDKKSKRRGNDQGFGDQGFGEQAQDDPFGSSAFGNNTSPTNRDSFGASAFGNDRHTHRDDSFGRDRRHSPRHGDRYSSQHRDRYDGHDHNLHMTDKYHGVRQYDPWKDIPERRELGRGYTDRLKETLGADYLEHHGARATSYREREPISLRKVIAEELRDDQYWKDLKQGVDKSKPTYKPPPANNCLKNIPSNFGPGYRDTGGMLAKSPSSLQNSEPFLELGWWPLPRAVPHARQGATTLGVKLDNYPPGTSLLQTVGSLTDAYERGITYPDTVRGGRARSLSPPLHSRAHRTSYSPPRQRLMDDTWLPRSGGTPQTLWMSGGSNVYSERIDSSPRMQMGSISDGRVYPQSISGSVALVDRPYLDATPPLQGQSSPFRQTSFGVGSKTVKTSPWVSSTGFGSVRKDPYAAPIHSSHSIPSTTFVSATQPPLHTTAFSSRIL